MNEAAERKELALFHNGLVPVYETDKGEYVVNGRELWDGLESKQDFSTWMKKRIAECDAVENEDFEVFHKKMENLEGGRPMKEYIIKLDTAKEMAMLERNEIGKQVRKYFISIEKKYKKDAIPQGKQLLALAILEANKVIEEQDQKIKELEPKASYYDVVLQTKDAISVSQIAKDYGKSAMWLNQYLHEKGIQYSQGGVWLLYTKYAQYGYTKSKTHIYSGSDGQQHSRIHTHWTQKGRLFIYSLLKQDGYLPLIEQSETGFAS